jgi:hypothetical protein
MRYRIWMLLATVSLAACDTITGSGTTDCTSAQAYSLGASISGSLSDADCQFKGTVGDVYGLTLSSQTTVSFTLSAQFAAVFSVSAGTVSGTQAPPEVVYAEGRNVTFFGVLAAGTYSVLVGTEKDKGDYAFSTSATSPSGCADVFTTVGVSVSGTLTSNDCVGGLATVRQDIYEFRLRAGQTINVSARINRAGAVLLKTGDADSPNLVTRQLSAPTGGSTQFAFTASADAYYRLHLLTEAVGAAYSASIQ